MTKRPEPVSIAQTSKLAGTSSPTEWGGDGGWAVALSTITSEMMAEVQCMSVTVHGDAEYTIRGTQLVLGGVEWCWPDGGGRERRMAHYSWGRECRGLAMSVCVWSVDGSVLVLCPVSSWEASVKFVPQAHGNYGYLGLPQPKKQTRSIKMPAVTTSQHTVLTPTPAPRLQVTASGSLLGSPRLSTLCSRYLPKHPPPPSHLRQVRLRRGNNPACHF